jgi:hypothetical protein
MKNPEKMMVSTIAAFKQWRQTRVHRTVKTPLILQTQAAALLAHFSYSKITSALNISGTNLKCWFEQQDKQSQTEFITLPPLDAPSSTSLSVTLTFNNGAHMCLCGELSPDQLTAITQSVAASSRAIS